MFKTREREDVYIVEKIVKDFNKIILISLMHHDFASSMNINTIFLNMYNFETEANEIVTSVFTNLMNVNINLMNVINESISVN